jgi:hypothetical protein
MTSSWDWKTNISMVSLNKTNNPKTGTPPPLVVFGGLYPGGQDDRKIYLYGGTTSFQNTSFPGFSGPTSAQYTLWSYDPTTSEWNQFDITDTAPNRPNSGAYTEAPDQDLAFYFNGQIDQGSQLDTQSLNGAKRFMPGMIVINTHNQTARNLSTDAVVQSKPRTRGKMTYLPAVGKNGILVLLTGTSKSVTDTSTQEFGDFV